MSPSILVIGATGNTGGGVLQHLSSVLPSSKLFSKHRLIGLTRDTSGPKAKELSQLPNVEMVEQNWVMIDAAWLKSHSVQRIFIAYAGGVSQFTDESLFLNAALEAGVEYVVRISTTTSNVSPTTPVFYARNHWAVEAMLEHPNFNALKWTSLQPNIFSSHFIPSAQAWLKEYRETGKKAPFKYLNDGDEGVAVIDPVEVGLIAGHLLALDDPTPQSGKKYCLVGPTDASGKDVVGVIEKHAGTTIDDVTYRDMSWLEGAKAAGVPVNVLNSLGNAPRSGYTGGTSIKVTPTSPEVLELYTPKHSFLDLLDEALGRV